MNYISNNLIFYKFIFRPYSDRAFINKLPWLVINILLDLLLQTE